MKRILPPIVLSSALSGALCASSLFVGFNTSTPVQMFDTSGNYVGDFGPAGAIAAMPDSIGDYFVVTPDASFTSSVVTEYNSGMSQVGSFTLNNLITDMGASAGQLLFSSYDGTVYRTTTTGTILSSWSTGYSHVGVTSDGTNVYTTEGDNGNLIDIWSDSGASTGHIATPFVGLYGLGYDSATGDLWAGSTNYVYGLGTDGSLLSTLNLPGDSRTPNGAIHDSLEVGSLATPPPPSTVPEPSFLLAVPFALVMLALARSERLRKRLLRVGTIALSAAGIGFGSVSVTLTPSIPSGVPVGTTVTWTAVAKDSTNANATFSYQFSSGPVSGTMQIRRDFYRFNSFPWTQTDSEGAYMIEAVVKSSTGATGTASASFSVTSRVTGGSPVISDTSHPLVALYSMPPCPTGHTARVRFKLPSDTTWQATNSKTCTGTTSLNFYVAGMRATTAYQMQQDVFNGPFATIGALLTYTTRALPAHPPVPSYTLVKKSAAPNDTAYPVLLVGPTGTVPYATDASGNLIWYLSAGSDAVNYLTRPVAGGTFLAIVLDTNPTFANRLLREYDLVGNLVRETNFSAISQQLVARGGDPITTIHHEGVRLPNGWTAFLGSVEKVADQGSGTVDVVGDQAIVVDENFQVKFSWNEFDHLDIMRPAILGETCIAPAVGCAAPTNPSYKVANDWTHSNGLGLAPDGNMIVSIRHQDWIIKFTYQNGTGNGSVIWKLGNEGDFKLSTSVTNAWFSHQHEPEYERDGTITLFDNGNTRIKNFGGNSRGQAWRLDEANKVASLPTNIDLGENSMATGSAQLLSNGNYTFNLGFVGQYSNTKEYTSTGVLEAQQNQNSNSYRSFRMRSLYTIN